MMFRTSKHLNNYRIIGNLQFCCYRTSTLLLYASNHYDTLNVSRGSSQKEIKDSYYKLSKTYHPDVNKNHNAEHKFKEIQEAYGVLSDSLKKLEYDNSLDNHSSTANYYTRSSETNARSNADNINVAKKWKNRATYTHSGRTSKYDFDEYYRQHYPEMLRRRQIELQKEFEMRKQWDMHKKGKDDLENDYELYRKKRIFMYLVTVVFFITTIVLLETARKEEEETRRLLLLKQSTNNK